MTQTVTPPTAKTKYNNTTTTTQPQNVTQSEKRENFANVAVESSQQRKLERQVDEGPRTRLMPSHQTNKEQGMVLDKTRETKQQQQEQQQQAAVKEKEHSKYKEMEVVRTTEEETEDEMKSKEK